MIWYRVRNISAAFSCVPNYTYVYVYITIIKQPLLFTFSSKKPFLPEAIFQFSLPAFVCVSVCLSVCVSITCLSAR